MNITNVFYALQQPFPGEDYSLFGNPRWEKEFGYASWADEVHLESIRCPVNPGHQRAGERINDLIIVLPSEKVGDFVWTWYGDCLLTDRVLHLFQEAGFSGFTVKPALVKPKTEKGKELSALPTLWELVVTGKGGDADPKSGIRLIYTCPHCGMIRYSSFRNGIIVNEQSWDGSDFFTISGYRKFLLVTERVKNFIIEHGLINCAVIPSHDLVWKSLVRPEDFYGNDEERGDWVTGQDSKS